MLVVAKMSDIFVHSSFPMNILIGNSHACLFIQLQRPILLILGEKLSKASSFLVWCDELVNHNFVRKLGLVF